MFFVPLYRDSTAVAEKASKVYVPLLNCNGAAVAFIIALIYLLSLILSDVLHSLLLLRAVDHAMNIENLPQFKGLLGITNSLTTRNMSRIHLSSILLINLAIGIQTFALIVLFWNNGEVGSIGIMQQIVNGTI
jgi:hypothetical protein